MLKGTAITAARIVTSTVPIIKGKSPNFCCDGFHSSDKNILLKFLFINRGNDLINNPDKIINISAMPMNDKKKNTIILVFSLKF